MSERVWLVLSIGEDTALYEVHVLPVEARDGSYVVASGHRVSTMCGCGASVNRDPVTGGLVVSHAEPSWPGADPVLVLMS